MEGVITRDVKGGREWLDRVSKEGGTEEWNEEGRRE